MEAALSARTQGPRARSQVSSLAAADCQVYWPAPYEVCGAIRDKHNELGGPNSFLLLPTSNELTNPDGHGKRSVFQNGPIYWSAGSGAHPVVNHFFAAWQRNGWEAGPLGYPTSDEIVNSDNVGRRQDFQGGTTFWRLNQAYYVTGAIRDKWGASGGEAGRPPIAFPVIAAKGEALDQWWSTGIEQRSVCESEPYDCFRVRNARGPAFDLSKNALPEATETDDNRIDAARHCIWNGLMTEGANQGFAQRMAGAHELDGEANPDRTLNACWRRRHAISGLESLPVQALSVLHRGPCSVRIVIVWLNALRNHFPAITAVADRSSSGVVHQHRLDVTSRLRCSSSNKMRERKEGLEVVLVRR